MNKSKFILGIAITILGGSIMLESMMTGIFYFTKNFYEDFQTLKIELQARQNPLNALFFSVQKGQLFFIWFRFSNKQIANKNLKLAVSLIDEDGNIVREFGKDFRFGHFRKDAKKVNFFKLGQYVFKKEFRGYLQYEFDGTWTPTKTSALVLRKSPPVILPLKQIVFFLAGLVALLIGIEAMAKNYHLNLE